NTWQVFHTASANEHDRVLLQVVADARNIGCHLDSIGQAYAGHFAQRRVRLLGRLRVDAGANPALLLRSLQCRTCPLVLRSRRSLTHQLIECRQTFFSLLLAPAAAVRSPPILRKRAERRTFALVRFTIFNWADSARGTILPRLSRGKLTFWARSATVML